ncbi:MAG TPA: hypothetical protein ENK85_12240 [Saprospiraceae bacterium]|nr:hypothetical protein [Saprospiraceae bacterium]
MEITPIYQKPILYSNFPVTTIDFWEDAVYAFDEKEYVESLTATFNYINRDILEGVTIYEGMDAITYPHGSADVKFKLQNGIFYIQSTFLKVPQKYKVPLLRKVAELNFTPLTLAQIVYSEEDGGILGFAYEMPIELVQPNKVFELVKEICIFADEFDDEFIQKYGASFYHKPFISPLSDDEQNTVWEQFAAYLDDALSYIEYFEEKRWQGYIWDTIVNTLLELVDHAYINGVLRTSIEDKIWFLRNDPNSDLERKVIVGKDFLQKLQKMPKEVVMKDVFLSKKFISTKLRTTTKSTFDFLDSQKAKINTDIESNNFINAYFGLKYAFLMLMYTYNLEAQYWQVITDSLVRSSRTSWQNGTKILKETFDKFISGDIDAELIAEFKRKPKKKGFFAKLFN